MAPAKTNGALASILNGSQKPVPPLLLIQYDLSVTPWPMVRHILQAKAQRTVILAVRFTQQELLGSAVSSHETFLDRTGNVVGYVDDWIDPLLDVTETIQKVPTGQPVTLLIDSIDTIASDYGSTSKTLLALRKLISAMESSPTGSKLILPISAKSPLLPQLQGISLSTSLTHITLHAPELLSYISSQYLIPPPLADVHPTPKFWNVFLPAAQRAEGEKLVLLGQDGAILSASEGVAEVLIRSGRKGPERTLEAWKILDGRMTACRCGDLTLMQGISKDKRETHVETVDVTSNLPFNLTLTESQSVARAGVPLPYVHQGTPGLDTGPGSIHYDPDSADDLDDEDPDEDLDL